ncbi:MAG TPA: amidohydrolase [Tenuifilaceae bacterium]|mgnify:FL=1|jgi:predicted amidohydrolase|nr:amidohydrolase [Bacteroidales bacterium]HQN83180.1 amidohydrolase [Tenuifilaceae bacterium]
MKISIIQASPFWESIEENLQLFTAKIESTSTDTNLILLPEMFTTGFTMKPRECDASEAERTLDWMLQTSMVRKAAIVGSIIARKENKLVNRMAFVMPNGQVVFYDKRHLFRMAGEHNQYSAGNQRVVVSYMGWRILLTICYDLRFPVWCRNRNDYDLMLNVANFPDERSYAWNSLLVARAIENQCFVAACNRVGIDGSGANYSGDSQVVDPMGQIVAKANPNSESTIEASISLEQLHEIRASFPAHLDADRFEIH